ncbi:MAG: Serine/threonine-protein kinase pkn1 [Chlamydiae bacterium]|nr:Serine/threonine-protein kinase pkn1 [Chlamydiota bacterium]
MENRCLGDYQIVKQIGQGTLGSVYLAEHRFMKRPFVIKVLPTELASDRTFVQRFEEEVSALSTLDHPNIVKIHNVSFAEGMYFLVLDCVVDEMGETTNLTKLMQSHRLPLKEKELFSILEQVASALDFAHQKKVAGEPIIHRCLKPNNILVSKGQEGLSLQVSDFGLSRIIGIGTVLTHTFQAVAEAMEITTSNFSQSTKEPKKLNSLHNSFLQNFYFLSPEQKIIDAPHKVDIKTDVFSFGVLAYYLMFHSYPEGIFSLPSKQGLGYKADWDYLITRCLQKDPKDRPEKLVEVLDEIKSRAHVPKKEIATQERTSASKMQVKIPETAKATVGVSQELKPIIHSSQIDRPDLDHDPAAAFEVNSTVKVYHPEEQTVADVKPMQTEMVIINGGTFWRGSNDGNRDEQPRHQVTISSFAIDVHQVTNEQFVCFLEAMGGEKDCNHNDIIKLKESRIKRSSGKVTIESGYAKHPVVGVTWYGAVAYAKWVGKRLPYEAEWEIAAKGGIDDALYSTGDDIEKTQANFFSSDTTAVKSYALNGLGIYDMAGNVYEWCYDWYGYNYYETSTQEPENPYGPIQGEYRVLRGGCWKSLKEDLRCSRRHRNNPGTVNSTYGFRCVADVQ